MGKLFKTLLFAFTGVMLACTATPLWVPTEARAGQAQQARPVRILALGDSLTQGYGVPPQMAFPVRLERALKARNLDVVVINAAKVVLTGNKLKDKVYHHHTGYIGGIKERTAGEIMRGRFPERVLHKANVPVLMLRSHCEA